MSEYIERSKAIEQCGFGMTSLHIADCIKRIPVADVVPVVRCQYCVYSAYDAVFRQRWCNFTSGVRKVKSDDFCSYGERKEA